MTAALEGDEWPAARPGRTLPPGKTRYPFYRRLGGPQGRSGRAENLVPTGIRYTHTHTHTYIHISGQFPIYSQLFTNRGYLEKMLLVFVKILDLWFLLPDSAFTISGT